MNLSEILADIENANKHVNSALAKVYALLQKDVTIVAGVADGGVQATANLVVSTEDAIAALAPAPTQSVEPLAVPPAPTSAPA